MTTRVLVRSWPVVAAALVGGEALLETSLARAQVVINEVDYDQPSADGAEFVELKNVGAVGVDLAGYALRLVNGANNGAVIYQTYALATAPQMLPPGGYFVVCANAATVPNCNLDVSPNTDLVQNGAPDALALLRDGAIVDAVSYEGLVPGYTEGSTAGTDTALGAESLSRCPDGVDNNDNGTDFQLRTLTPGLTNACGGGTSGPLGSCGEPATLISAIQGTGETSPMSGQSLVVEGVVVADFQDGSLNGFYVQEDDADSDANPLSSEGIFVFEGTTDVPVELGQRVRVRGDVSEFGGLTELSNIQVAVCGASGTATAPIVSLPVGDVSDLERFEGMRVVIPQTLTVTSNYEWGRFGSLDLSANGRLYTPTQLVAPGSAAIVQQDENERRRIVLDDASNVENPSPIPYKDTKGTRRLGDTVSGLSGILDDRFSAYRIQPITAPSFVPMNPQSAPAARQGRLRITPFNVLNYFSTIDTGAAICGPSQNLECRGADSALELERQRLKILNAMVAMDADVFGLIEIENNPRAAVADLVSGLNDRRGPGTYTYVDTGTIGTDAIKLAFVYKPGRVAAIGSHALLTSAVDPRFVDTRNRPALAQTFRELATGASVTVVLNHLKSKGSSCGAGDDDPSQGAGNCNGTRTAAASALADWIATDPTHSNDGDFLLIGDLNSYAKEAPITTLEARGFQDLARAFGGPNVYSYQFDGQSGTLDYALATNTLRPQIVAATEWHINSDEPVAVGYNREFKTDDPYDGSTPFGASDHDPVLVDLNLTGGAVSTAVPSVRPAQLAWLALLLAGSGLVFTSRRKRTGRG